MIHALVIQVRSLNIVVDVYNTLYNIDNNTIAAIE